MDLQSPLMWIEYGNCLLQYHFGIAHPEQLSDEEWATKLKILEDIRTKEAAQNGK